MLEFYGGWMKIKQNKNNAMITSHVCYMNKSILPKNKNNFYANYTKF